MSSGNSTLEFIVQPLPGGPPARAVILAFLTVVGVVGNAFTVIVVCIDSGLRTTGNYFIVYLAFVDLLFCAIVDPMAIVAVTQEGWPLSQNMCSITSMLSLLNLGISVGLLAAIAFNRCIRIVKFQIYQTVFTPFNTIIMCVVVTIIPLVVAILPAVGIGQYGYNPILGVCTLGLSDENWIISVTLFAGYTMAVEFFIMMSYTLILIKVIISRNRLQNFRIHPTSSDGNSSHPSARDRQIAEDKRRSLNRQVRVAINLFIVFLFFFLTWMPITLMSLIDTTLSIPLPVWRMVTTLAASSSTFNPCIYAWRNKQFRKAYKKIFKFNFD